MPFCAPRAVTPVMLPPVVPRSRMPPPYRSNASACAASRRSSVSVSSSVECRACRPAAGDVDPADAVVPPAFEPDAVAISPDGPAEHRDAVHVLARHAGAHEAVGHRVPALERDSAQIDPRARGGRDDDPALGRVGDPVTARADPHVPLHLGAGAREAGRTAPRRPAPERARRAPPRATARPRRSRPHRVAAPGQIARAPREAWSPENGRWWPRARRALRPRTPRRDARAGRRRPRRSPGSTPPRPPRRAAADRSRCRCRRGPSR